MHCINSIRSSVRALGGISKVDIDMQNKKVTVVYDSEKVNPDSIKDAIDDAGYKVV